jgi:hypothetical protein
MRFRPANIRLINRRSKLPRLLLVLSSGKDNGNDNDKNNPTVRGVDTVTPYQAESLVEVRFRTSRLRLVRQLSRLQDTCPPNSAEESPPLIAEDYKILFWSILTLHGETQRT